MLAQPHLANAAATTATVWWTQGFAEEEDVSFKKIVADYEKASGNTIDYTITPYAPLRQKIVSAVTSGVVPDLFQNTPAGRRAGLSPLAGPRPSVLLGQSPDAQPWQFGFPGVPAKTKKPLSVTSNTVPALFARPSH